MIFDRTQQDVDNAIRIRAEKVQTGLSLSEKEIEILERGTMTINTINRIEEAQDALKNIFNDMGYWNTPTSNKHWNGDEIFTKEDFERIVKNLGVLKNAFFVFANTPETPKARYDYESLNAIEKILNDLDLMINDVKSHYRECGTFECGGDI